MTALDCRLASGEAGLLQGTSARAATADATAAERDPAASPATLFVTSLGSELPHHFQPRCLDSPSDPGRISQVETSVDHGADSATAARRTVMPGL